MKRSEDAAHPRAPDFLSTEAILAHPDFRAAFDALVDGMAGLYVHSTRLRILVEYRRAVCFALVVAFDAARDPSRQETIVTTAKVQAAMAQMGVRNRRVVADLIAGMRDDGYVTVTPADHDRRVREIRATEKARDADREWLQVFHAPLAILRPGERRIQLAVARDPDYQRAYRVTGLSTLAIANTVMETNPEADYFVKANVGARVMMVLFQAIRGRADRRTDPGFYSWAAERSGVSHPHVRKLLRGAEERGFVILSGGNSVTVEVTPRLAAGVERWTAAALSATDLVSALAWDLMTGGSADPA